MRCLPTSEVIAKPNNPTLISNNDPLSDVGYANAFAGRFGMTDVSAITPASKTQHPVARCRKVALEVLCRKLPLFDTRTAFG